MLGLINCIRTVIGDIIGNFVVYTQLFYCIFLLLLFYSAGQRRSSITGGKSFDKKI